MTDEIGNDQLILNVDDTEAARYLKSRMLSRAGYTVIDASGGAEALVLARSRKPALIVLDVKMPGINGYEVCRALKDDPETRSILILQTSASFVDTQNKIRALDNGADNYLAEPFHPEEFIANVRALLRLGRVERELREVGRRKDEFLAVLAHELRNPLAPIRTAMEVLREMRPDVPSAEDEVRAIVLRQTEHLTRLVDDLLDVARISRGQIRLRHEEVAIGEAVRAAVETSSTVIQRRKHTLRLDLPAEDLWVRGDAMRISQAIANLLNNAAKFTPVGGVLQLMVRAKDRDVSVVVQDNGIGIEAGQQLKIFNLFAQAGHAHDRVQDGLGIGLFLVKTLMEMHGGRICVASGGLNAGSEFELLIPRLQVAADAGAAPTSAPALAAEAHPVAATPKTGPGALSSVSPRRIMVVDDNIDAATMISSLLELAGHVVEKQHDGAGAIACAQRMQPEVVVLDLGLPDMSGLDVARALRPLPGMGNALIIALTGYAQERDKAAVLEAGFDLHLTKPISFHQLAAAMAARD